MDGAGKRRDFAEQSRVRTVDGFPTRSATAGLYAGCTL